MRPGIDPNKFMNIAKIDLSTGEMEMIHSQPQPGQGSALVTNGDLVFWGDMNRRFRAFDADSGKVLWETVVGGMIMTSTITYAVNGKQYVAILTGDGQSVTAGPLGSDQEVDGAAGARPQLDRGVRAAGEVTAVPTIGDSMRLAGPPRAADPAIRHCSSKDRCAGRQGVDARHQRAMPRA